MKWLKNHIAAKSIGGIVLLLIIFFAVVSFISYNSFTEALLTQYSEGAFTTAHTAARMINADRMDAFAQDRTDMAMAPPAQKIPARRNDDEPFFSAPGLVG